MPGAMDSLTDDKALLEQRNRTRIVEKFCRVQSGEVKRFGHRGAVRVMALADRERTLDEFTRFFQVGL